MLKWISLVSTLCLLTIGWIPVFGQLEADFTTDISSGCAPLVVKFQDESSGNPTSWRWEMGDGTILFVQDPATTYFKAGTYTVKLVIQDASGFDSLTKISYIKVYEVPEVNFKSSETSGCFPLPVQFTDLSLPMSGTTESWEWDFGDGSSSEETNPVHVYDQLGEFNVSLRIHNSNGCVKTLTRVKHIKISSGVKADFNFSAPDECKPPTPINFNNRSSGIGALNYRWEFGDGSVSTERNPSHTYNSTGNFDAILIVKNESGCVDTARTRGPIAIGAVKADFSIPGVACAGAPITLQNTSEPQPHGARWTFGDGTQSSQLHPKKTFAIPGTYSIRLSSDFGACKDSIIKNIEVLPSPSAAFNASGISACQPPLTTSFKNNDANAVSFKWLFGDGNISSEPNPSHIYQTYGDFDVTLMATNSAGCSDTVRVRDFVRIRKSRVEIINLRQEGCVPYTFQPLTSISSGDSIINYQWDFGDSSFSTERFPSHIYTREGSFRVKLIYTTEAGCTDSVIVSRAVRVGNKPVVSFSALPQRTCAFQPVSFSDLSTGSEADRWHWQFGDGGSSTSKNPNYSFKDTGYFSVRLIVTSNGCKDSLTIQDYVYIKPPVAKFIDSFGSCEEKFTRWFKDQSIGATSWHWDFGDGNTTTVQHPVHTFSATGEYIVSLTVKNDTCEHTVSKQVIIIDEYASFTISDTVACKETDVQFTATNPNPKYISSFLWDFGDEGNGSAQISTYQYASPGNFTIQLNITDLYGCSDSLIKPLHIRVNGPSADFSSLTTTVCNNATVVFNDSSVTDGINPIITWIWNYGDGTIDTLNSGKNFQHIYHKAGFYTTTLKVIDSSGCADAKDRPRFVTVSQPTPAFRSADTLSCATKNIHFTNQSSGNFPSYKWNFGDGGESIEMNPVHTYFTEGDYSVKLIATDSYGCIDSLTRPTYIHIRNPQALFSVSDSVATCPPLVVEFTNQSENINYHQWDFGDGTTSALNNPGHFYTFPGIYPSKLRVTSPGGCTDSTLLNIVVRGPEGDFSYTTLSGCNPTNIAFKGTTKDNAAFVWDFNDGKVEDGDSIISHTYTRIGAYLPKMILVDPQGCRVPVVGKDTVRIYGVEPGFTSKGLVFCDSAHVSFNDKSLANEPVLSYSWNFGDGSGSNEKDPVHLYGNPGNYPVELTVKTLSGCINTHRSLEPVTIAESPVIEIIADSTACVPAMIEFKAEAIRNNPDSLQWKWDFRNGSVNNSKIPLPVSYQLPGQYTVSLVATNAYGCRATATKTFIAHPKPLVDAGLNQVICQGAVADLAATGALTYRWGPGTALSCTDCPSPKAAPTINTTYYVTGRNIYGCNAEDSISVKVKQPFAITVNRGDTICKGEFYQLSASGAELYTWSPSFGLDNPSLAQPKGRPDTSVVYQVIGRDDANCFSDTAYIPLVVYPYPVVEAGEDQTIPVGNSVHLKPQFSGDVVSLNWVPSLWLDCPTCAEPQATPKQNIRYRLEVMNAGGCISRDEISLHVFCNNSNLFLPNTFTPNGDGRNDVFYPEGKGLYAIKTFRIFNRWGEIVFERTNFKANDIGMGWNGSHRGSPASKDVYVYTVDVICENQVVIQYKGNVALLR